MSKVQKVYFVIGGKYHDMDFARLEFLKLLAEQPTLRVTVAPHFEDVAAIQASDWLMAYTVDLVPSPAATQVIRDYVASGKRFLALHGTNSILKFTPEGLVDSPEDNTPFMELLGTQFKAHPPIGPFKIDVKVPDSPMTEGISDFETIDELYVSKIMSPDIRVLMSTTFSGECTGFVDSQWPEPVEVPMLHLRPFGAGEVLYYTLGHARGHYDLPEFTPFYPHIERCSWNYPVHYEILRRGIRWGMGELTA
jgi:type 1 glutamine amidotransferase